MAVKKFMSRQNPNTQLDLRFCAEAGCEALSDVLAGDLPFSRSAMLSLRLVKPIQLGNFYQRQRCKSRRCDDRLSTAEVDYRKGTGAPTGKPYATIKDKARPVRRVIQHEL